MWRYIVAVFSFAGLCLTGSHALVAQQAVDQAGGALSTQGPQLISGEELRASRQPGQLVGGDAQQVGGLRTGTDATGQAARPRVGGIGGQRQLNQLFNQFNTGFMNSRYNLRQQLRFPVSLGFKPAARAEQPDVGNRVQNRLARIPRLRGNGPMTVEMDGPVAVLRGKVGSQDERDLVARVVLLEPGIADVRNELQVAAAGPAP